MQVASTLRGTIRRHPRGTAMVALLITVVGGLALYWFAPWNLFVDRRVDEALPGASAEVPATGSTVEGTYGIRVCARPTSSPLPSETDSATG